MLILYCIVCFHLESKTDLAAAITGSVGIVLVVIITTILAACVLRKKLGMIFFLFLYIVINCKVLLG